MTSQIKNSIIEQQIIESISEHWNEINRELIEYDTELLLFDFSYIINNTDGSIDVSTHYQHRVQNYDSIFEQFIHEHGNAFAVGDSLSVSNFNIDKVPPTTNISIESYSQRNPSLKKISLDHWHDFVDQKNLAGSSLSYFSQWENIADLGVYLLLTSPIVPKDDKLLKESIIVKHLTKILQVFLFKEGKRFLESKYSDIYERTKTAELYSALVRDNRHTIINSLSGVRLDRIIEKLEDNNTEEAKEDLRKCHGQLIFVNMAMNSIVGTNLKLPIRWKNISEILDFLYEYDNSDGKPIYENGVKDSGFPDLKLENDNQIMDVFLLLWNLWHNAGKKYIHKINEDINFWIKYYAEGDSLVLSFKNHKAIEEKHKRYLIDGGELSTKKRGLPIIKNKSNKLGWGIDVNTQGDQFDKESITKITLSIKR